MDKKHTINRCTFSGHLRAGSKHQTRVSRSSAMPVANLADLRHPRILRSDGDIPATESIRVPKIANRIAEETRPPETDEPRRTFFVPWLPHRWRIRVPPLGWFPGGVEGQSRLPPGRPRSTAAARAETTTGTRGHRHRHLHRHLRRSRLGYGVAMPMPIGSCGLRLPRLHRLRCLATARVPVVPVPGIWRFVP